MLESPESLARGMFPKRLAGNPRELPISSHQEERLLHREVRDPEGRPEGSRREGEQSYDPSTGEGGEPQGFGKERPRYPLEGRGKQATHLVKET